MENETLPERMQRLWKRIEPGTDDVVLMTQISATLAEAAHELWKLQNEHASLLAGRFPTHRCKVCGALWIEWGPDPTNPVPALRAGSWSLFTPVCGKCCDNVAMGEQIERLPNLHEKRDHSASTNEEK